MITAVLLSWKRPRNIPVIVKALRESPHIGEVIVFNQGPGARLAKLDATVINSGLNFGPLARFAVAMLPTAHELIFLQDDDVLVTADQLAVLVAEYQRDPERLVGIRGRNLGPNGEYRMERAWGEVDGVLQAYLATKRAIARVFDHLPAPVDEDDLLMSLAQPKRPVAVNVEPVRHLDDYGEPGIARWRRKDHLERRALAISHMRGAR